MKKRNVLRISFAACVVAGLATGTSTYISSEKALEPAPVVETVEEEIAEETPMSTPVSEWTQGTYPHLYQIDPQWKDIAYLDGTIEDTACGPTALTMVYVGLTGNTDYDVPKMAEFVVENGYVLDNMTAWTLMYDGAAQLGLSSTQIKLDKDAVISELEAGHPIIMSVGPGDFTDKGHFIVLTGLASNGSVWVNDPNSVENSEHTWSIDRILKQAKGAWAFSLPSV